MFMLKEIATSDGSTRNLRSHEKLRHASEKADHIKAPETHHLYNCIIMIW